MTMAATAQTDHALRTMCDEGNFRILIASTTETVRGVLKAQSPPTDCRALFADLISAAVLLRLTMSPDNRLQVILQHQNAGSLVGDSHPDGVTRGLARLRPGASLETGPSTLLSVHRTMFGGKVHQGVVETSQGQSLADAVTGYLHHSEQITSVVGLGNQFDGDELSFAGGYIVQHLPDDEEADEATLALMTARLENLPGVPTLFKDCDYDTQAVADELFGPIGFETLASDEFHAGCVCSPERVVTALNSLSDDEIEELTADGETLEVDCDYCTTTHQIEPGMLR